LAHDDTTVSALARHLGVDWHTAWDAVEAEAARRVADPARLAGVSVLASTSMRGGRARSATRSGQ
jgi:hypothetical protein